MAKGEWGETTRFIVGQGANVARSSGDNGRNREHQSCTMPSLCFGIGGAQTIAQILSGEHRAYFRLKQSDQI